MPRVSGIELAKHINKEKPYINVIVVSAYSEFEYARELIRCGVLYYLLKFVDLDEFLEAMDIVRENIESGRPQGKYDFMQAEMFFYDLFENNFSSYEEALEGFLEIEPDGDFENAYCLKLALYFSDLKKIRKNKRQLKNEMLKNVVLNVAKFLHPNIFVTALDLSDDVLNLIFYNKGGEVGIGASDIERELKSSFDIEAKASPPERLKIKSIFSGEFSESESFENGDEKKENAIDFKKSDLPPIVRSAVEIIEENYSMPIIRSEIADRIHVNVVYLSKAFKKHTGKTLMSYLCECRMKRAAELAIEGKTINEICEQIGYNDERGFRRAFKKYTGCSVREYKKQFMGENGRRTEK